MKYHTYVILFYSGDTISSSFFINEDQKAVEEGNEFLPNAFSSVLSGSSKYFIVAYVGKYLFHGLIICLLLWKVTVTKL